jgi:hypothetical protein
MCGAPNTIPVYFIELIEIRCKNCGYVFYDAGLDVCIFIGLFLLLANTGIFFFFGARIGIIVAVLSLLIEWTIWRTGHHGNPGVSDDRSRPDRRRQGGDGV